MTSHRLNFTKAALLKAPNADKGKKDYYYDDREKGLVMAVTQPPLDTTTTRRLESGFGRGLEPKR